MRRTQTKIDQAALIAIGIIVVGWFLLTTFVVNFGLWQENIRFYDLLSVVRDPAGRFSSIDGSHPYLAFGFGLVCAVAVLAPLAPLFYKARVAWLTYLIPFALMAVGGAVLYAKTSGSHFHVPDGAPAVSTYLARIAERAADRVADLVATRISIGAGAYISFLASCWLALRGWRQFRAAAAAAVGNDNNGADLTTYRQ